jgi:ABC-2 type transport system permease protein
MLIRIIRHDLRLLVADKTLWIVAVLFAILIGYGTFNGMRWAEIRARVTRDLDERGKTSLTKLKEEAAAYETGAKPIPAASPTATPAPLLPTGKNYTIILPPAPLTALSLGQADIYPYSTTVDIYTSKHQIFNFYEQDNPLNLLAGNFDLAFVFVFLFPLVILVVSYNLLSGEKEGGTLAMTLAQSPVGLRRFLTGKVLSRLLVVLGLATVFSIAGFALAGVDFSDPDTLTRILLWFVVIALYAIFWFAVAAAVNALGFSSATNAGLLAGIWIVLVIVMPALLNVAATTLHPAPSRIEFVSKQREADNFTRSAGEQLLAQFYGDHPELVPAGRLDLAEFSRRFFAVRQEMQWRMLPELERFDDSLEEQNALVSRYRVLSPAVVVQESLNDIAGTSAARHKNFVAQIRSFVDEWQAFFVPRVMRKEVFKSTDYDQIPRFDFTEEPTTAIGSRVGTGALLLLLPSLLIGALAFWRLRAFPLIG